MKLVKKIQTDFISKTNLLDEIIESFDTTGEPLGDGERNKIRITNFGGQTINIKSFKKPKLINKIAYRYFRKSKAERSYTYANRLHANGIGTPQPIGYYAFYDHIGIRDSYYISKHMSYDLTYRELVTHPDYPDHETILRQFTHFTHALHEKGIFFKDHSPGNTLIKKNGDSYDFYLVDLNRMDFMESMSFDLRMKNFSRLTPKKEMVAIMSDEYAKITQWDYDQIHQKMWELTDQFQQKYYRKIRLKKKYLFWRKK